MNARHSRLVLSAILIAALALTLVPLAGAQEGEESGRTGSILLKTAATFDMYVKNQMSSLVAALQPALILFLGIAVGGITITMLSAVFSMP